jgi:hypothetical protein
MRSPCTACLGLSSFLLAQAAPPPQHVVAPATYATTDAVAYEWIAGASRNLRQQTLVGVSHLQSLVNHDITAIEFRRTDANEVYAGGTTSMNVTLSTSPRDPLTCSSAYADNVGNDAALVFSGQVTLPTSPATTGSPIPWSPNNIVRVAFVQPFHYHGGTLCVDLTGTRIVGQEANWWMADAMCESVTGTTADIGNGCGAYGGPQGRWSDVDAGSLVPGGYARLFAYGPPYAVGFVVFGAPSPTPIPLAGLGVPTPNCYCHLQPGTIVGSMVVPFLPEFVPDVQYRGGVADFRLHLPSQSWVFGLQLTTQWFELSQMATSNAITWTVASSMPSLDMALNEGDPGDLTGEVTVHLAHVLRFEYL